MKILQKLYDSVRSITGATIWESVTPDNDKILNPTPRAIYIGGSGDLVVEDSTGNEEIFTEVVSGAIYELQPSKIKESTTATNILILR